MNRKRTAISSMSVVCFFLGIVLSMQLKAINHEKIESIGLLRANQMSIELNRALNDKLELERQLIVMSAKLQEYEQVISHENNDAKLIIEELNRNRMLAGLTPITGQGIEVLLADSKKKLQDPSAVNTLLIHDEDILNIINELNAAGCEGIAINNQRFISNSSVRCIGPVISVNAVKIAAPYTIHAIGNPEVLESALKLPGGVIDSLSPWGIEVSVKKMQSITLPKYDGAFVFNEASIPIETSE